MSWNYRVVKQKISNNEVIHEIKEVYYDKTDNIASFGDAPTPYGDTVEDIKQCLDLMYKALDKPVIDYDEFEKEYNKGE